MDTYTIYLAGPIAFCDDKECMTWREKTKRHYQGTGIRCLDPLRRDYRGRELTDGDQLVNDDLEDIAKADALLVGHTRPSTGTAMEIVYARQWGKLVVVVEVSPDSVSPWTYYHADYVTSSWESAYRYLQARMRGASHGFATHIADKPIFKDRPVGLKRLSKMVGSNQVTAKEKEQLFKKYPAGGPPDASEEDFITYPDGEQEYMP